jgi:hypothetical protein
VERGGAAGIRKMKTREENCLCTRERKKVSEERGFG